MRDTFWMRVLSGTVVVCLSWAIPICAESAAQTVVSDQYDVRRFGAVGDGKTDWKPK